MINLLPKEQFRQLRAARSNVLLLRYNIGLSFVALFLGLVIAGIYFFLVNIHQTADATIVENQAKVNDFGTVRSQADEYRANLAKAKELFDKEIRYSKIYLEIARLLPSGTALDTLSLTSETIDQPLTLAVKIRGEDQAISALKSFQSSEMFNKSASYGSLTMNSGDDKGTYPYIITLQVTINKGAIK